MQFLKCACYLAGLGILSFVLGRLVPKTWFDYTRFPYRTFAFERNGKLYEALRVSRWQSRVPDMSRLFSKLMPPKKMPARPDEQTLLVMIRETCAAEATHTLLMLAGLGVNSLSMTPVALDDVRASLAEVAFEEAQARAEAALNGDFYHPAN